MKKKVKKPAASPTQRKPNGYVRVNVFMPEHTYARLVAHAQEQHVDPSVVILKGLYEQLPLKYMYDLDTKFNFGKYEGETVQRVIDMNPGYVKWAMRTITGFQISDDVRNYISLKENMSLDAGVNAAIRSAPTTTPVLPVNPEHYAHQLLDNEQLSFGYAGRVWACNRYNNKYRLLGYFNAQEYYKRG